MLGGLALCTLRCSLLACFRGVLRPHAALGCSKAAARLLPPYLPD